MELENRCPIEAICAIEEYTTCQKECPVKEVLVVNRKQIEEAVNKKVNCGGKKT